MILENMVPFGHYKPGDLIEVPDDDVYDTFTWRVIPSADVETKG